MKAIQLNTICQHCNKPVTLIISKEQLNKMFALLKMNELIQDLTLKGNAYAKGIIINPQTLKEMNKIGKQKFRRY